MEVEMMKTFQALKKYKSVIICFEPYSCLICSAFQSYLLKNEVFKIKKSQ